MTRAEILIRVQPCIWVVSPRSPRPVTEETCLVTDLWMHGPGIVRLGELLEEEFSVTLTPSDLVKFALEGPTLRRLADLIEDKLDGA